MVRYANSFPISFVVGSGEFGTTVFRAVWPGEKPELEESIGNLARRVSAFVKHFLSSAELLHDKPVWAEDTTWKQTRWPHELYQAHVNRAKDWDRQSFDLLMNVVVALNEFAGSVRTHLESDYFITEGRFTVFDSMGLTNEMEAVHYLPSEYISVRGATEQKPH